MASPNRSMDEIVAHVVRAEQEAFPRLGRFKALLWLSGAAYAALLLMEHYLPAAVTAVADLAFAGPPMRVLIVVGVVLQGAAAAFLLQRSEEPAYPVMAHGAATGAAAAGIIGCGAGIAVVLAYTYALSEFFPAYDWLFDVGTVVTLGGAGFLVGALAPLACSTLRGAVDDRS